MENDKSTDGISDFGIFESINSASKFIIYLIEKGGNNIDYDELSKKLNVPNETLHKWYINLKNANFLNEEDGSIKLNIPNTSIEDIYKTMNLEANPPTLVCTLPEKNKDSVIFNGDWFKIMKNNKTGNLYFSKADSVVILPLFDDNTVLFEKQYRSSIDKSLYEIPAGSINPCSYENLPSIANKKLFEETGYVSKEIYQLFSSFSSPGVYNSLHRFFLAKKLEKIGEPEKGIELERIDLDTAIEYIKTGNIEDSKTSLAILYHDSFIRNNKIKTFKIKINK